jgi:hypothetical protein
MASALLEAVVGSQRIVAANQGCQGRELICEASQASRKVAEVASERGKDTEDGGRSPRFRTMLQ